MVGCPKMIQTRLYKKEITIFLATFQRGNWKKNQEKINSFTTENIPFWPLTKCHKTNRKKVIHDAAMQNQNFKTLTL